MAKNQSLPAHLQEKDFGGDDSSTMPEHHEKPPPGDQSLAFQTHALQMTLYGSFYVRIQPCCGSTRIVSLQNYS